MTTYVTRAALTILAIGSASCDGDSGSRSTPTTQPARDREISGRLVGHDGAPMKLAHVHLDQRSVAAGADGRFQIAIPATGLARLRFSGVDHAEQVVPIAGGGDVELDVRLGTYDRPDPPGEVELLVVEPARNGGQVHLARRIPMRPRPDGKLVADVEHAGPDLAYEIGFAKGNHSVNGTQSDRFTYDGGGDYASHVAVRGGRVSIELDLERWPPASRKPEVTWRRASPGQAELARIHREVGERIDASSPAAAKPRPLDAAAERAMRDDLGRRLPAERDPLVRGALLASYFASPFPRDGAPARALAAQLIAEVPADSELWELWPLAVVAVARAGDAPGRAYAEAVAAKLERTEIGAMIVVQLAFAADRDRRTADVQRLRGELTTRYAKSPMARMATALDPDRKVRPGQPMPAFEVPALDDPTGPITRETLRGRLALIEVWATWCKPCVAEMPNLHELHETFGDRIAIVSIDLADPPAVVRDFRKTKWPMPWQVAVVETTKQVEAVTKALESFTLPTSILVDAGGTIVATGEALRGPRLAETVTRALAAR